MTETNREGYFEFTRDDVWLLFHNYAFDFTVWELWGPLLFGGRLVVPDDAINKDVDAITALCQDEQVSVLNATPSFFEAVCPFLMADVTDSADTYSRRNYLEGHLRYIIFGGEALKPSHLSLWWQKGGAQLQTKLVNMYGITETCVHVTFKVVDPPKASTESAATSPSKNTAGTSVITIGKPIQDMAIYILDNNLKPVPIGVPGEIYVAGAGLAVGYLNRPELSNEKFISNPFVTPEQAQRNQTRMYKTGDRGRWVPSPNGCDIEHMGRNDFQVKIRGFRIELSEIESHLKDMETCVIEQAVVIDTKAAGPTRASNRNHVFLAAYVVVGAGATFSQSDAVQHLSQRVPKYMIPSTFNVIDHVPLTFNGKLDRRALPIPNRSDALEQQTQSYLAPRNNEEKEMCELWEKVLGIDSTSESRVGINDNFFQLGGHSLQAAQLVALCKGQITVKDLHTCSNLAELVATASQVLAHSIKPRQSDQQLNPAPLSAFQMRLFVVDRMGDMESSGYHIP